MGRSELPLSDQVITPEKSFAFHKAHFVPDMRLRHLHNPILDDNTSNIS